MKKYALYYLCNLLLLTVTQVFAIETKGRPVPPPDQMDFSSRSFLLQPFLTCAREYLEKKNQRYPKHQVLNIFKDNIQNAHHYEINILNDLLTNLKVSSDELELIINGAKIVLDCDQGFYYKKWSKVNEDSEERVGVRLSSHPSYNWQRHYYGSLFHEFLFGTMKSEDKICTWFQIEDFKAGINAPIEWVRHSTDYILGKILLGYNISAYGISPYIDDSEVIIKVSANDRLRESTDNPYYDHQDDLQDDLQEKNDLMREMLKKIFKIKANQDKMAIKSVPAYRKLPLFSYP